MNIYLQSNTDFENNGLGFLTDCLTALVTEELNGVYNLVLTYPANSLMTDYLVVGNIIKCKVENNSYQLFRISSVERDFNILQITAQHIFYDLNYNFIEDAYPKDLNCALMGEWILSKTNFNNNFKFYSNISGSKSARYVRKNPVECILGNIDNSMVNLFNAELERDNFTVKLLSRRGNDNHVKLIIGKNITEIKVTTDISSLYTRIMPVGYDGLLLPEKYVDSPLINMYPSAKICKYEFEDIKYDVEDEGAYHSEEEAYTALRNAARDLFDSGIDKPSINIKINWLELSKTNEYRERYSYLEKVFLGDTIYAEIFGLNYETRVIKTTYNPLTDMLEKIELGTFKANYQSTVNSINKTIQKVNKADILNEAKNNATNQLTKAMAGYVYKTQNELFIMDTDNPATANHIWRWNLNGLGYSSTGINGPYGIAITQDGRIVADFITTGQLDVSIIKGLEDLVFQAKNIKLEGYVSANGNVSIDKEGTGTFKNVKIEDGQLMLQDTNDDQSESIFIYNADSIETLYPSVKIGEKLNKLYFNFPDSMEPDKTGTNISKVPIVTFENGYIYYNYGYQYSDYANIWLYDSTTEEETIIYKLDNAFERIEVNLKELELPKSIGKIISIDNSYKNNDTLLSSYITNKVLNIKYYTKYASNGIEMKKDNVTAQYLANGVNINDSNGTRAFNENGICWMTPPGEDYKDFIVNKDIVSFNGNKLVEGLNIDKLNIVDQDSPYLEVSLLENVQGYSTYGINVWASDKRLKKNINGSNVNALNLIKKIQHREFKYKNSETLTKIGYVADELESIDPQMIFESGPDKLKQPKVSYIVPVLSKAIQEQQNIIENLVKKVELLERKVNENN